jgi:hypothetical protein
MTLLLPAADRVVREAVDAMLDGRVRPGAGSDISFATRSSRYRVIHGVLREATDASLVGARFVGWLFDGVAEPRVTDRWDTDARAVLLDEVKGQIVVTSITRVHVANALAPGEGVELPPTQLDDGGRSPRASTLHGMAAVDPEPEPQRPRDPRAPAPLPAAGAPAVTTPAPAPPQQPSPKPRKLTIPPAPPIPGRQNTPVPGARPMTPIPGGAARTQPMAVFGPPGPPAPPPPPPPSIPTAVQGLPAGANRPVTPLGLGPRTLLGVAAATRPPPPSEPGGAPEPAPADAAAPAAIGDAPLPQFDLDDLDDMPTRADPTPPVRPSEGLEEVSAELDVDPPSSDDAATAIPLVPRTPSDPGD